VFFDNVRVPAENLVGGENNGWKVATTHLEIEHGGLGRLADRRVVYDFLEFCRQRHDGYAIADDPDARAELVEMFIEAEITRLFALRNHWLAHTGKPRSYEGAQYSLRRKLSGLDIAERMLRIAGPRVLTKDERWGPLKGMVEYFQRDAITTLHPGATTDIQRVIMARRIGVGRREREKAGIVHWESFFYPLDMIGHWNRMYGKRGFTQYQCVLPESAGRGAARRVLDLLTRRGGASFLCVIKDCGPEGKGMLSFPMKGISIALDIAVRDDTQALVDALNEQVIAEGGRIYLAKDTFTRSEHFRAMEKRLDAFLEVRRRWDPEGRLRSAQSVRLFGDRP